jgi:hypothetical protein
MVRALRDGGAAHGQHKLVIVNVLVGVTSRTYGPPRDCKGKALNERHVCANVFVNKGEGVVKVKDVLPAA